MAQSRTNPTQRPRQVSFAGGEFAPGLQGRTDLSRYPTGCKTLLNFMVGPYGQLVSRPGTRWVLNEAYGVPTNRQCIKAFVFSNDVLILHFTENGLRVYRKLDGDTPAEKLTIHVTGSWDIGGLGYDYRDLVFSQSGDTIVICHPLRAPRALTRTSSDSLNWTFADLDFHGTAFPTAWFGTPCIKWSWDLTDASDSSRPLREWTWAISRVMRDEAGKYYETTAKQITLVGRHILQKWDPNTVYGTAPAVEAAGRKWVYVDDQYSVIYEALDDNGPGTVRGVVRPPDVLVWNPVDPATKGLTALWPVDYEGAPAEVKLFGDKPVVISWWQFEEYRFTPPASYDRLVATRIYRGRDGRFGYVGQTTGEFFTDDGADPDWDVQPPSGISPFDVFDGTGLLTDVEIPVAVTHHEGRRVFAGTNYQPSRLLASAVQKFADFFIDVVANAVSAIGYTLVSSGPESIKALVPSHKLVVMTDCGEWLVGGSGQGEVLTAASVAARPIGRHGSLKLQPLAFGDDIVFASKQGGVPKTIRVSENGGMTVVGLAPYSLHLFADRTIVAWEWAGWPWNQIWAVCDDGSLLVCTYIPEQELVAWSRHEIAGGEVEDVTVCREAAGEGDSIYLLVRRTLANGWVRVALERLGSPLEDDPADGIGLDHAVTVDGLNTTSTNKVTVPAGAVDTVVSVTCTGETVAGEKDGKAIRVWDSDGDPVDIELTHTGGGVYDGLLLATLDVAVTASDTWALLANQVAIPSNLRGMTVWVVADGQVSGPHATEIADANINIGFYAQKYHIGLHFDSDFESLDAVEARGRQKIVTAVTVELEGSRGVFVGESLAKDDAWVEAGSLLGRRPMQEVLTRQITDGYAAASIVTDSFRVPISGEWNPRAHVAVRKSWPLPIKIVGLLQEVDVGG